MLHTVGVGDGDAEVVFLPGLFGQGRNWAGIAKALDRPALLIDPPNHGRSPWTDEVSYAGMADAVAESLPGPIAVVGHSMGGKIAMALALRHPDLVTRLCVVDVSPVTYTEDGGFDKLIAAMRALDLSTIANRTDADQKLRVGDPGVRGFLLQNLRPAEDGTWAWQMNLELLARELPTIRGWDVSGSWDGPVLWVSGADSDYVREEYEPAMEALFPKLYKVTVKDSGHWVHSDQPKVMTEILQRFLA